MGTKANVLVGVAEITLGVGVDARVVGYTTDGVTMTVRSDFANVKVDEIVGTNIRVLTDQEVEVSLNMAEGELENLVAAIPGASLTAPTLTLGGGDLQEHRLTLVGTTPAGRDRVIVLTLVNPVGEVTTPYKKGEVSVVPVTFAALVDDSGEFGEVVDAQAAPPTFDSAVVSGVGSQIDVTFSKAMADPAGKHLEFWFTEDGFVPSPIRAFDGAVLNVNPLIIELSVDGVPITGGQDVELFYSLGTVLSDDIGVLQSFGPEIVGNP